MFMLSFLEIPVGYEKDWISIDLDSFGNLRICSMIPFGCSTHTGSYMNLGIGIKKGERTRGGQPYRRCELAPPTAAPCKPISGQRPPPRDPSARE
jgi:hypothetical protein